MEYNKKIGKNGGFTLPSALRRDLGIQGGEKVKIETSPKGSIVINRIIGSCLICKVNEDLAPFKGRYICQNCLKEIKQL